MKPENIKFCEDNIDHLRRGFNDNMRGISNEFREGVARVIAEDFRPGYKLHCDSCEKDVLAMVKLLAIYYFQWRDSQPIEVHANFPKHDKE